MFVDKPMSEATCTRLVMQRALECGGPDLSGWLDFAQPPCELCGRRPGVERHHRKFRSRGGVWLPSNIVVICSPCHLLATEERHPTKGVNINSWKMPPQVPILLWHTPLPVLLDDDGGITETTWQAYDED